MPVADGTSPSEGSQNNCGSSDYTAVVPKGSSSSGQDMSWDGRIRAFSCLAFALGCVWILLFPLVTLTTGEPKPRGTFFDENAMLIHHTTVKLAAGDVEWAQPGPLSEAYPQVSLVYEERTLLHKLLYLYSSAFLSFVR